MSETIFLRLLSAEDKAEKLAEAVAEIGEGTALDSAIYAVDPNSFRQVPGTPFAYWVSEHIRHLFTVLPQLETEGRDAQSGASTMNDFRFLRCSWEIPSELEARDRVSTTNGKRWVPFGKGGVYSRFYSDWELVIDWANDGEVLKKEVSEYRGSRGWGYQWTAAINGHSFYFRPGLTWPRRTQGGFNVRALPKGCIIGDKGPTVFVQGDDELELYTLLAVMNSHAFRALVDLQMAFGSFEVGVIERTPIPRIPLEKRDELIKLSSECLQLKRKTDSNREISHVFVLPASLQIEGYDIRDCVANWKQHLSESDKQLDLYQREIDDIAFQLYGIDQGAIDAIAGNNNSAADRGEELDGAENIEAEPLVASDQQQFTADLVSYCFGCIVGRWDVRYATGERSAPKLQDPFAPLPVCALGGLTGADGLPLRKSPPGYQLRVDWDGILVDDADHNDDIIRRVRDVFDLRWHHRAEEIEHEACSLLGIKTLREYFRKPGTGGFWMDHVKRYSKSRRKAPIYWYLRSSKGNYAIWLYYHRLDKDILFKALLNYVEPKLRLEENNLAQLKQRREAVGTTGREGKQVERDLDKQESFLSEVYDFRDKLKRVADLNLEPDINDGVVLNIAPLWELVPWKEAEKYWKELIADKYEWSSIGKQLREQGLLKQ